ncbi:RNA-directed DNA polymerase, eukaryota [Tanacetum coccineum]
MISKPMTKLLMKDVKFDFSNDCKKAFNILKEKLTTAPIIISPDWKVPFKLMCDASDFAVRAVLGQRIDRKFKPIYYAANLNNARNITSPEEELLAVVFSFDKFRPYLVLSKIIVYTDHSTLKDLFSKQDAKPRLIRSGNISSRSEMPQNNIQIEHNAYWALKQCNMDLTAAAKNRFMELNKLIELKDGAYENTWIYKERTKRWHDSRLRGDKNFKVGDMERIFKKRTKRKPKASNSKHGVEKGKVKSQQSKKIQLEGPKLPKPQVVLQKRKTRVKIARKVEIAFKLYNLRGPFLPTPQKVFFPAPKNPVTTGKIYWIRVKEQETWSPKFIEEKDEDSQSGEETDDEKENDNGNLINDYENDNDLEKNELDHVSESSCMHDHNHHASKRSEHPINSDDPFEIYKILEKNNDKGGVEKNKCTVEVESTDPQFPPGFTPDVGQANAGKAKLAHDSQLKEDLLDSNEDVASVTSGINSFMAIKSGGSLSDVIDELIKVGHAMGYNMDGCLGHKAKKGWIQELNTKHRVNFVALQETKMERIDIFSIKALWGNLSFDYVCSPFVGYSGGILCVWDPSLFLKDNSTISDSFVAIRGDFNEVRSIHERYGIVFNSLGANSFNNFITMAGLVDLPLEGYSYTWSHKSASKMSKLDRFMILEGLLTLFPSLSALCLDRHLSDHRPILMREFVDPNSPRLIIDFQFPNTLSMEQLYDIERDVTYDEIKNAVWDCETNKSPGHDGFTFEFFRRYWKLIDDDVVAAILQFFSSANRLSLVISSLISDVQSAFVSNRQILDGPFILNELLSWCKHKKSKAMIFKVDFEKAFDSLTSLFKNMVNAGLYKGIPIDDSLILSHLFYADDVVFIGKWDKKNVTTIVNVLKCFFLALGLKIILQKSKLMGIGIPHEDVLSVTEFIGCSIFNTPFNFLGVKVGDIMSRRRSWEETIDRKLSLIGWKNILASKKNRGLGVSSFFDLNSTLLFKWIWLFISHDSSLWAHFIKAIYGTKGAHDISIRLPARCSPWLITLCEFRRLSQKDPWLSDLPLKQLYPRVFRLELEEHVSVASKLRDMSLMSSFRRAPRGGIEEDQFLLLRASVAHILLPWINDRWV